MILPDEVVISGAAAVLGGAAWFVKAQLHEFRKTIDRNTEAMTDIRIVLQMCKLKQEGV